MISVHRTYLGKKFGTPTHPYTVQVETREDTILRIKFLKHFPTPQTAKAYIKEHQYENNRT